MRMVIVNRFGLPSTFVFGSSAIKIVHCGGIFFFFGQTHCGGIFKSYLLVLNYENIITILNIFNILEIYYMVKPREFTYISI